jgi:hypothetical protein
MPHEERFIRCAGAIKRDISEKTVPLGPDRQSECGDVNRGSRQFAAAPKQVTLLDSCAQEEENLGRRLSEEQLLLHW